ASRAYTLQTTFPTKDIDDEKLTLKDAGLLNAVVAVHGAGVELAVRSMRVGERAKLLVMPEYTDVRADPPRPPLHFPPSSPFRARINKKNRLFAIISTLRAFSPSGTLIPLSSIPPFRNSVCAVAMCAELAEPENWDLANLSSAPMALDIHLLELEEAGQFAKKIWEMSSSEKWAEARALKERGACLYGEGRVAEARDSYACALALLESLAMFPEAIDSQRDARAESERAEKERERRLPQPPNWETGSPRSGPRRRRQTPAGPTAVLKDGSELRFSDLELLTRQCRLNYAACCLRVDRSIGAKADLPHQGALQAAVEQTTRACVKALFCRAQAYSRIGRALDLAERDLADLVEKGRMNADDPEFVAENRVLRDKAKAARETEKTMTAFRCKSPLPPPRRLPHLHVYGGCATGPAACQRRTPREETACTPQILSYLRLPRVADVEGVLRPSLSLFLYPTFPPFPPPRSLLSAVSAGSSSAFHR
ncbi:MAG: hypothetical protein BJ554DRAFT_827, partial [Olpidium bornovanus]